MDSFCHDRNPMLWLNHYENTNTIKSKFALKNMENLTCPERRKALWQIQTKIIPIKPIKPILLKLKGFQYTWSRSSFSLSWVKLGFLESPSVEVFMIYLYIKSHHYVFWSRNDHVFQGQNSLTYKNTAELNRSRRQKRSTVKGLGTNMRDSLPGFLQFAV